MHEIAVFIDQIWSNGGNFIWSVLSLEGHCSILCLFYSRLLYFIYLPLLLALERVPSPSSSGCVCVLMCLCVYNFFFPIYGFGFRDFVAAFSLGTFDNTAGALAFRDVSSSGPGLAWGPCVWGTWLIFTSFLFPVASFFLW